MNQTSTVNCPKCGIQVSEGTKACPICQARIRPIEAGRLITWIVIAALMLVIAILWALFARR